MLPKSKHFILFLAYSYLIQQIIGIKFSSHDIYTRNIHWICTATFSPCILLDEITVLQLNHFKDILANEQEVATSSSSSFSPFLHLCFVIIQNAVRFNENFVQLSPNFLISIQYQKWQKIKWNRKKQTKSKSLIHAVSLTNPE